MLLAALYSFAALLQCVAATMCFTLGYVIPGVIFSVSTIISVYLSQVTAKEGR
jgi:hypothetical protein